MEQIIKFGISNYLQLCVEAGFSQIQSQIFYYSFTECSIRIFHKVIALLEYIDFSNVILVKILCHTLTGI